MRDTGFCKNLVKSQSTIMTKAIDGESNDNNKKNIEDVEDYMNGYPWPPRCYPCSFCKREFKSAQALGGHMNVHRKDRARLRSSPPTGFIGQYTRGTILNLNLISNPNPNLVASPPPPPPSSPFHSVSTKQLPPSTTSSSSAPLWMSKPHHPPHTFSSPSGKRVVGGSLSSPLDLKTLDLSTQMKNKAKSQEDGCMKLDLEIGVLDGYSKEDIDLELRLGCFGR